MSQLVFTSVGTNMTGQPTCGCLFAPPVHYSLVLRGSSRRGGGALVSSASVNILIFLCFRMNVGIV